MNQTHWCTCEGHNTGDFVRTTDFYSSYFQPIGWALEYDTLLEEAAEERTLYLTGQCGLCFNFMRAGMTLPIKRGGEALLAHIWTALETYRPFAFEKADAEGYTGCPPVRGNWYQRQNKLSEEEKEARFAALFHDADKEVVEHWLAQRRATPHIQVVRDSAEDLFRAIVLRAKQYGDWQEAQEILDYYLPSEHEGYATKKDILTAYEFNFYAVMQFGGSEGIYIDCSLRGKFDDSGRTVLDIGTIKTLETNMDACKRMGALCGALIYHASAYVNENLHRYTPDAVLCAEAARLEEWRTVEAYEMEEAL